MIDSLENIECFFFDLDGTLLDLSDDKFDVEYIKLITNYFIDHYDPETFLSYFMPSVEALMSHDDNENLVIESFLDKFSELSGMKRDDVWNNLHGFYSSDFGYLRDHVNPTPISRSLIDKIQSMGKKIVLATNPVFPEIATRQRVEWAGLNYDEDFLYVPHVNNSRTVKPNPKYYQNLIEMVNIPPEKILMVGNDFLYDGSASQVGIKTWIVDFNQSHLEYKDKFQIDHVGSLDELFKLINTIT
ncbi:MAG: HAD family hydrolase [Candidatus Kariarchaeaceae archaeon]